MTEITSNMLNFADMRRKASSSQAYRVKIPSSNGTSFNLNQTIDIDLPANVRNTYLDFASSYISLQFTNGDGAAVSLNGQGIYSIIKKIECVVGSQTLFSCDNYNQLVDMLLDQDSDINFKQNTGRILMGTHQTKFTGFSIGANGVKQFCFPLVGNILYNTNKYIPLFSAEKIRLKLTLDSAAIALRGDANLVDSDITISQVEMVCYNVVVDEDVQTQIDAMTGGLYTIIGDNYSHVGGNMVAQITAANVVTGFSYGSLNRVLIAFNPTASRVVDRCSFTRTQNNLLSAALSINGQKLPQREIKELSTVANDLGGAEALAEVLVADKCLASFAHGTSFNANGASSFTRRGADADSNTDDGDIGTYMIAIDTERVRGDSDKIYSGINTIGASVQAQFEFGVASDSCNIDCFANYTTKFSLDASANGTRVWSVQV